MRFRSMTEAKDILSELIKVRNPTFNDLLRVSGRESISYGDKWCWPDLAYDILSNKYRAAAKWNNVTKTTSYCIYLPPVVKMEE